MIDSDDPYDVFWLDLERDLDRDIADPPRGLDLDNDAHREAVQHGMLADEERRRRAIFQDERKASISTPKEKDTTPQAKDADENRPDRSFPSDIERRFYVQEDRNGDRRVYADSKATLEIFQESENRLRTKLNDEHAVKLMLDTATHRGWSSVTVKGAKDFRREAWLEGQARGIAVSGYKATELDLQELKQREQSHLRNEIQPDRYARNERTPDEEDLKRAVQAEVDRLKAEGYSKAYISERSLEIEDGIRKRYAEAARSAGSSENSAPIEHTRSDRRSLDFSKQGVEGILVEKGTRPYRDNNKNDPSPYVLLEDDRGRQHTVWGVGLPDALVKSGAKEGDHIRLRETGMERVTETVLREVDGKLTRVNQDVNRRAWEAQVIQEREAARDQTDNGGNATGKPNMADREARINAAERRIDRTIVGAEKSLHVGPGRDAALEDGGYANEHRAREYMANGRAVSAKTPELRGAASIEAYVERKLRAKFPDDPTAVLRGMAAARTKISQIIARGQDFPTPRVVETHELDQAKKERTNLGRTDGRTRDTTNVETHRAREQIREQDRDVCRTR